MLHHSTAHSRAVGMDVGWILMESINLHNAETMSKCKDETRLRATQIALAEYIVVQYHLSHWHAYACLLFIQGSKWVVLWWTWTGCRSDDWFGQYS